MTDVQPSRRPVRFVAYYRVSTDKQGIRGLGMKAQRATVESYVELSGGVLLAEFQEVESGGRAKLHKRPMLQRALRRCKIEGAVLVIAKLDRLARDAAFVLSLRDTGVDFIACDFPQANRLMIGILALVGEYERELISQRTKAALAAAKKAGQKLGGWHGNLPAPNEHMAKMRKKHAVGINSRRSELWPIIAPTLDLAGGNLNETARLLNTAGVPTASKKGQWTAELVRRIKVAAETGRYGLKVTTGETGNV